MLSARAPAPDPFTALAFDSSAASGLAPQPANVAALIANVTNAIRLRQPQATESKTVRPERTDARALDRIII
jgi:hypothetical protein